MTLDELRALATVKDGPHTRFQPPYRQMSICLEEAEFLYALVRALKPRNVLELGTGLGLSGRFIVEAIIANQNAGQIVTVEPNEDLMLQSELLLGELGYPVTVVAIEWMEPDWPQLVYIDSRQSDRWKDIRTWLTNGYTDLVLVHDAERDYAAVKDYGHGVYLPTANGMWLGRAK